MRRSTALVSERFHEHFLGWLHGGFAAHVRHRQPVLHSVQVQTRAPIAGTARDDDAGAVEAAVNRLR